MERSLLNLKIFRQILWIISFTCLFISFANSAWSKNYVKIATIGPRSWRGDVNIEPQKVVDRMIKYWQNKFAQVLSDRPDLIVVPEACDRPANFSFDKQREYYRWRRNQIRNFFASVAKENYCLKHQLF